MVCGDAAASLSRSRWTAHRLHCESQPERGSDVRTGLYWRQQLQSLCHRAPGGLPL